MTDQAEPNFEHDDLSGHYMAHVGDVQEQSALAEMLSRAAKQEPEAGAKPAAPGATPAAPAVATTPMPTNVAPTSGSIPPVTYQDLALKGPSAMRGDTSPSPAAAVWGDVLKGATLEAPRAIVKGIRDAYQNTINLTKDVGSWVEHKANLPSLYYDPDQKAVRLISPDEKDQLIAQGKDLTNLVNAPEVEAPKTQTGKLISGITQFVVGFKGVGKVMEAAGLPEAAGAAGYLRSAAQGFGANLAVFDPQQQRLSNLVEQFPSLSNPVTRFLEAKPDDSKAEGRFKNALEGLGLGVLSDAVVRGVGILKDVAQLKETAVAKGARGDFGEIDPNDPFKGVESDLGPAPAGGPAEPPPSKAAEALGDSSDAAPLLLPSGRTLTNLDILKEAETPTSAQDLSTALAGSETGEPAGGKFQAPAGPQGAEQGPTRINFARIESPDDVKRLLQEMMNRNSAEVDVARRGVRTWADTQMSADQENAWDILNNRRIGQALNAEQLRATQQLWIASGDKLKEITEIARGAPTPDNEATFLRMMEVHRVIQAEVQGSKAEAGRALNILRQTANAPEARQAQIADIVTSQYGGEDNVKSMINAVWGMQHAEMPNELEAFVAKSAYVKTRDGILQAYKDALLTNPVTQTAILASNASTALWRIGERWLGEKYSATLGSGEIAPGEAAAMWSAYTAGWRDTLAAAWKSAKIGETGGGIGEINPQYPSKLSSEALGLTEDSFWGKAADYVGTALSLGRRGVAFQHDVALTFAYRAELNAQALRMATGELNAGKLTSEEFGPRIAEILQNPPPNLVMSAQAAGKYQAFLDEPGWLAQGLLDMRAKAPGVVTPIIPFVKIPARITSYTFERTPLAPLMERFQSNIAAGGADKDLAIAQLAGGALITMAVADMTMTGRVKWQGPVEMGLAQAQQREGEGNYSIRVGDRWVNLNRVHPIGKLIGLVAAVTEGMMNGQHELKDDADTEKLAVSTALAISGNLVNSSYTQGLSNFFAMVHDAKVGGAGENALFQTAGSLVPSGVAAAEKAVDPYQRAVYSMLDEFKSRIPGLSSTLPPKRDLWGNPVHARNEGPGGIAESLLSPVASREATHSPIDDEILKQGMNITMPSATQSFGRGATVDMKHYPEAYSRFLELAGNGYKDPAWGLGAKDLLDSIVSGGHPLSSAYNLRTDGPDGGKEIFVRDIISKYRDAAKRELIGANGNEPEFPKLKDEVEAKQEHAQALKMPQL